MQPYRLTIDKFLDHAAKWFPDRDVIEADAGAVCRRIDYAGLRERSNRLSGALATLGLGFGDRVGTLAWNTQHHLEIYYAAMGAGMVCHTLNPRLTVAHLATMIDEAEERVLVVAADLLPLLRETLAQCPAVAHVVVIDAPAPEGENAGTAPCAALVDRGAAGGAWRALHLGRLRRERRRRALLYLGHDRPAEGRRLHAPVKLSPHAAYPPGGRDRPDAGRRAAGRRADVPCERMGPAVRRPRGRCQDGPAGAVAGRGQPGARDARRRGDDRGGGANRLAGPGGPSGGDGHRPARAEAHPDRRIELSRGADPADGGAAGRARAGPAGE